MALGRLLVSCKSRTAWAGMRSEMEDVGGLLERATGIQMGHDY